MMGGKQKRLRLFGSNEEASDDVMHVDTRQIRSRARKALGQKEQAGEDDTPAIAGHRPDGQRDNEDILDWMKARERGDTIRAGEEGYDEQVGIRRRGGRQRDILGDEGEVDRVDDFVDIEIDEELVETVAIGLLCVGLTSLLYLRGRWMRRRREQDEEEARRRGGGGERPLDIVDQQQQERAWGIPIDFAPMPI
jgi:SEL1 protein